MVQLFKFESKNEVIANKYIFSDTRERKQSSTELGFIQMSKLSDCSAQVREVKS